jgi:hypothetical protein
MPRRRWRRAFHALLQFCPDAIDNIDLNSGNHSSRKTFAPPVHSCLPPNAYTQDTPSSRGSGSGSLALVSCARPSARPPLPRLAGCPRGLERPSSPAAARQRHGQRYVQRLRLSRIGSKDMAEFTKEVALRLKTGGEEGISQRIPHCCKNCS